MAIRDGKHNWNPEAQAFGRVVSNALRPIFNEYKEKFTFEEMYYLVCTLFNDIIIDEILGLKHPNSEYGRRMKG